MGVSPIDYSTQRYNPFMDRMREKWRRQGIGIKTAGEKFARRLKFLQKHKKK